MAKELPYFQFEPAEYLTKDISFCSLSAQGLFINICCFLCHCCLQFPWDCYFPCCAHWSADLPAKLGPRAEDTWLSTSVCLYVRPFFCVSLRARYVCLCVCVCVWVNVCLCVCVCACLLCFCVSQVLLSTVGGCVCLSLPASALQKPCRHPHSLPLSLPSPLSRSRLE